MNPVDAALQAHTPAVMVPKHEALAALDRPGHRFLVSRSGLWVEAVREWCRIVWPVSAGKAEVQLPFGEVEASVELRFGRLPEWAIDRFVEQARAAYPMETAGVVVWCARTDAFRYVACEEISASRGHVKSQWPALGTGECVVMDLHSHGALPAFFSGQDRADIGSEIVVAAVVGRVDQPRPEIAISLFACGLEIPVSVPAAHAADALSDREDAGILRMDDECEDWDAPLPAD